MGTPLNLKRIMIFVDENDKYQGKNLAGAIVETAKREGFPGATVIRGVIGFGSHKQVHSSAGFMNISISLPEIIIIVDTPERIQSFLPTLEEIVQEGLIVIDDVQGIKLQKSS